MKVAWWGVLFGLLLGLWSIRALAAPFTFSVRGAQAAQNQAFAAAIEVFSQGTWQGVPSDGQVTVALGGKAFLAALQAPPRRPVVGVAVNRSLASTSVQPGCHCTAIWRGVPMAEQLRVLHAMRPGAKRVGILLGPHSAWEPPRPRVGELSLQAVWVDDPNRLGQQLRSHLPDWDALLLPDDNTLFNTGAAKLILLTSYRQRVPVFGPDADYVRAGSVASAYVSANDMARAVVDRLRDWRQQGQLPAAGFAGHYSLTVNQHVARAYDLIIQDRAGLEQTLEKAP